MGQTQISPNLKKTSVRIGLDGKEHELKKPFPVQERKLSKEEEIAQLEEQLKRLREN